MAVATTSEAEHAAFRANALQVVDEWSVHDDDDGHLFYYNLETHESRWQVPDELRALETQFMMQLMVSGAIARCGEWTAHDTGNGTLYYFNEKTRESVWERPEQWGAQPVLHGNGQSAQPPPPPPPPLPAAKKPVAAAVPAVDQKKPTVQKKEKKKPKKDEIQQPVLSSAEQLEMLRLAAEQATKAKFHFKEMLRDKKIMPFCKWGVAFPQIAVDPRFLAVATMEERQEIFDEFVKNRRNDLQSEKKTKLKSVKRQFSTLLSGQFTKQRERGEFEEKQTLSLFLETLEDQIAEEEFQTFQKEVLAFLPRAIQEKLWEKEMGDFLEATKSERAMKNRLRDALLAKLGDRAFVAWQDVVVQETIQEVMKQAEAVVLSEAILQAVVGQVAKVLHAKAKKQAPGSSHTTTSGGRSHEPQAESHALRPEPVCHKLDSYGPTPQHHNSHVQEARGRSAHGRSRSRSRSQSQDRRRERSSRSRSTSRSRSRGRHPSRRRHSRSSERKSSRHSSRRRSSRSSRSRSRSRSSSSSRSPSRDDRHRSRHHRR